MAKTLDTTVNSLTKANVLADPSTKMPSCTPPMTVDMFNVGFRSSTCTLLSKAARARLGAPRGTATGQDSRR